MKNKLIKKVDESLGLVFPIKAKFYTDHPHAINQGDGILKSKEWDYARAHSLESGEKDDIVTSVPIDYIRDLFTNNLDKVNSALNISKYTYFKNISTVLELGAGKMFHAFVLSNIYPHLTYTATDFSAHVIKTCRQNDVLKHITMKILDVRSIDCTDFADYDLILSWGLDYALTDFDFDRLFTAIRKSGKMYLMCSLSTRMGPLRKIINRSRICSYRQKKRYRMHGWYRSPAYYRRLARHSKLATHYLGKCGLYRLMFFCSEELLLQRNFFIDKLGQNVYAAI